MKKPLMNKLKERAGRIIPLQYHYILVLFVLAVVVSCTPAKNDSNQAKRLPALQQNQVQNNKPAGESSSASAVEKTGNENNREVMLNPPHGQPGHRCEIPVGSPLNAPAVNTAPKTTAAVSSAAAPATRNNPMAPTLENANRTNPSQARTTTAPQTGPKPANNPPHGQPWHRCDIAVGSPLP